MSHYSAMKSTGVLSGRISKATASTNVRRALAKRQVEAPELYRASIESAGKRLFNSSLRCTKGAVEEEHGFQEPVMGKSGGEHEEVAIMSIDDDDASRDEWEGSADVLESETDLGREDDDGQEVKDEEWEDSSASEDEQSGQDESADDPNVTLLDDDEASSIKSEATLIGDFSSPSKKEKNVCKNGSTLACLEWIDQVMEARPRPSGAKLLASRVATAGRIQKLSRVAQQKSSSLLSGASGDEEFLQEIRDDSVRWFGASVR